MEEPSSSRGTGGCGGLVVAGSSEMVGIELPGRTAEYVPRPRNGAEFVPGETIFSFDQAMLCVLGVIVVDEPIEGESIYVLGLPAKLEPSEGANISARYLLPEDNLVLN